MKKETAWLFMWLGCFHALSAKEIYRSQFADGVPEELWDPVSTAELTPGGEAIVGVFAKQGAVSLSLGDGLPDHKRVRVRFDLLAAGGFAGNKGRDTDGFSVQVIDGPLLYVGSLCTYEPGDGRHSFPDEWSHADHPAQTGRAKAAAGDGGFQRYHFDFEFPHHARKLGFIFRVGAIGNDERWGISNVIVDALPELKALPNDAKKIDALWDQLSGKNPVIANRAVWQFIAAGGVGLKALEARANRKPPKLDKQKLAALEKVFKAGVTGLADDKFVERQKASAALAKLGPAALPLLDAAIRAKATGAGVRAQLGRIRKRIVAKQNGLRAEANLVAARVAHVERVLDGSRAGMRATSSKKLGGKPGLWDHPGTVLDGFIPPASNTTAGPRFSWYPDSVGEGWLRIDFGREREISEFGVFWFLDLWGTNLPAKWRLEYLAADKQTWDEVPNPNAYPNEPDKFNQVRFDKVKTGAVRVVATFDGDKSTGIHEIYVR